MTVFQWGQHQLLFLGDKAVWDPRQGLLLVADLHLGKAETFQAHGIPLPSDGDGATLNVLLALAHRWRPRRVVVLGDLIHSRLGLTAELRQKLAALPQLLGCPLQLIGGNHERGSWIDGLPQEPAQAAGALWLSHEPDPRPGRLNLCGHLHPVALLGRRGDRLRLPCFAYDPQGQRLALPSFGQLTGGHPRPQGEQLWLVAEGTVVPPTLTPPPPEPAPHRHG
ncbi:ligase-associated DNA damage response endonuclease PdeM [Synechococcus sp. CCY9201]|uniref:ligase-associated DNA damage response endonuclease PdeM n=1 Tax=Synechococcus sp. CCY9201 TaxID=174697 RepID=UPI002B2161CF|nr:ligase-associated DNA damage response endonuclease PdeM [Synechococcus sp. CCY9201]MEA5475855.1 ligase-associated DNA damage response endonuclease PdeM [Synechococcus sp. CCY9201]